MDSGRSILTSTFQNAFKHEYMEMLAEIRLSCSDQALIYEHAQGCIRVYDTPGFPGLAQAIIQCSMQLHIPCSRAACSPLLACMCITSTSCTRQYRLKVEQQHWAPSISAPAELFAYSVSTIYRPWDLHLLRRSPHACAVVCSSC